VQTLATVTVPRVAGGSGGVELPGGNAYRDGRQRTPCVPPFPILLRLSLTFGAREK
jgi:hypothetical protein